ncbi:hypothetical protein CEW46_21410 [Bacillus cereus]|nr:hypothetical protein CEW46_21410 [Bacillus cereus]
MIEEQPELKRSLTQMSVYELEAVVKEIYYADPTNPDLYQAIRDLATKILLSKRLAYNAMEIDEITHTLATDMYLQVASGQLKVDAWTKYVWFRCYRHRDMYLSINRRQVFDATEASRSDAFRELHQASKFYFNSIDYFELEDLINSIPDYIESQFKGYCRAHPGSIEYTNMFISTLATISNGGEPVLFYLPDSMSNYIRLLAKVMIKESYEYIRKYTDTMGNSKWKTEFTNYFELVGAGE